MCEHVACNPMQYPGKEWPKSKLEYRRLKEIAVKVRNSLFAVYDIRVDGRASVCFADVPEARLREAAHGELTVGRGDTLAQLLVHYGFGFLGSSVSWSRGGSCQ